MTNKQKIKIDDTTKYNYFKQIALNAWHTILDIIILLVVVIKINVSLAIIRMFPAVVKEHLNRQGG